jgi:nucleoside-diphosphate-sugar epimerase
MVVLMWLGWSSYYGSEIDMQTTTVLITGANGFVGSHILEACMQHDGITIIAACRDKRKLIPEFMGEVREGDLRDSNYLKDLLNGIDVVCHAAAWTSAWGHEATDKDLFLKPSLSLIDRVLKSNVSKFILLSSTSVAAPYASSDPMSLADESRLKLWPHMRNVAKLENHMRKQADQGCTMITLRVGLFAGRRYGIGLLPLLVPRLKTHLVPWVKGGKTGMPITGGDDIGEAFALAVIAPNLKGFQGFNIVGPIIPTVREVITFLNQEYKVPKPHFGVPFFIAYIFARTMELIDPVVPWEPLVTRSIIHLLEETVATNDRASSLLKYEPKTHWKDVISMQMEEMAVHQKTAMKMYKPIV